MKSKTKKIAIVGGALALLYLLYKQYNKKDKNVVANFRSQYAKGGSKPQVDELPKVEDLPSTPTPTPPFNPQPSSGGGTGGQVTNNQTVPPRYNPRDYGDIVLGNVDRGGNIRR